MAAKAQISWVLRAIAFVLLVLALFLTAPSQEARSAWILLDVSGSVRRSYARELQDLHAIVRPCLATLGPGDRVGLVVFGEKATLAIPLLSRQGFQAKLPRSMQELGPLPGEQATNFEAAWNAARAASPTTALAEFWIWSDGRETAGSFANLRGETQTANACFRLPFPPDPRGMLHVQNLRTPASIPVNATAQIAVDLLGGSAREENAKLVLEAPALSFRREETLSLGAFEARTLQFPVTISAPGVFRFSARVERAGPLSDPTENVTAEIRCGESRNFLVLGQEIPQGSLALVNDRTIPSSSFSDLFDGVLALSSQESFQASEEAALLEFLRGGGIFVFASGPESEKRFFRDLPRLEASLPFLLSPEESKKEDVLLLLDRSGSMAGGKFEIAANAAHALARTLPRNAELRVASFAERLGETQIWRRRGVENPESIAITPGPQGCRGGTNLEETLRRAVENFSQDDSQTKRKLLLLSDGRQTSPGPSADGFAGLAELLREKNIELIALAVGEDPDLASLRALTSQERQGKVIRVEALESLAEIFDREGSSEHFEPGPHLVRLRENSPFPDLPKEAPSISARRKLKTKPDAQTIYETTSGKPVLAMRREGLGVVLGLAIDPTLEKGSGWMQDAAIWESLLLSLPHRRNEGSLVLHEDGASFFPGEHFPETSELLLQTSNRPPVSFWKQGKHYATKDIDATARLADPWKLIQPDGTALPKPRLRNDAKDSRVEWIGGGRSILGFLQEPPSAAARPQLPFPRRSLLLAALGALLLSWLLPWALARRRSGDSRK